MYCRFARTFPPVLYISWLVVSVQRQPLSEVPRVSKSGGALHHLGKLIIDSFEFIIRTTNLLFFTTLVAVKRRGHEDLNQKVEMHRGHIIKTSTTRSMEERGQRQHTGRSFSNPTLQQIGFQRPSVSQEVGKTINLLSLRI